MSPFPKLKGLQPGESYERRKLLRDASAGPEKLLRFLAVKGNVLFLLAFFALAGFLAPSLAFVAFALSAAVVLAFALLTANTGLPFRLPQSAGKLDPNSPGPGHLHFRPAGGVFFLGNEASSGQELWLDKRDILTHALLLGTTGSGKTAALASLAFNSLATGSGLFYIDPKAEAQLNMEIWQMARSLGREDDFRVLNYASNPPTDPTKRLTNTNNPFSLGGADSLAQLLSSLTPPGKQGSNSIFADKAMALISGLMYVLTELRDQGILTLSAKKIRECLNADKCVKLLSHPHISEMARDSLEAALLNCNYVKNPPEGKQMPSFYEQYGYAQSYFGKALSSLTDVYEHIYGVEGGEVDFQDVVLNRRILLTLLPSMEKSPMELASLGKITLSSIRAAAAVGLGLNIEGEEKDVLGSLPIHFQGTGPFLSVVDEYAAIVTPGFEILLTQGRGLGMATVVASQDYAGLVEADPKGAQQIVANTNLKIFMKLAESEKTWRLLKGLSGEETALETTGFALKGDGLGLEGKWTDNFAARPINRPIVDLRDLMEQTEGEAHCLLGGRLARARLFHAGPSVKGAVMRVPRLLSMEPTRDFQKKLRERGAQGRATVTL
ncbi:MAG: TraM recognition domain-containing protein [Deltaproteobacteria bacterium]|jgi:intracellular multiplication protein IcmO|nr:TraM recognition domain-containing protein [Deltaproteobacteria bacterium]